MQSICSADSAATTTAVKPARRRQPRDHTRGRSKFPANRVLVVRLGELTKLLHHRYALGLDTDDADLISRAGG